MRMLLERRVSLRRLAQDIRFFPVEERANNDKSVLLKLVYLPLGENFVTHSFPRLHSTLFPTFTPVKMKFSIRQQPHSGAAKGA
jgi:hypothetical protein